MSDVKDRLAKIAVEDYLRDTYDLDEVARMTTEKLYKDLFEQTKAQVRQIISSLNIPDEIRAVADKRVMEGVPLILERNVPSIVEGVVNAKIGWYKETLESLSAEIAQLKKGLAEESSKRRKVHRAHMATVSQMKEIEARLKALEPQESPLADEPEKKGIFGWGRKKKPVAASQGADCP